MWFGTMSGLNRYDGYHFKVFHHSIYDSATLNDDYVSKIYEGPGNKLWIQTRNTFNVYDPVTEKTDRHFERSLSALSLPLTGLTAILKTRNAYWFLFSGIGLYRVMAGGKTQSFKAGNGPGMLADFQVADMQEDSKGHLWLLHSNGMMEETDTAQQQVIYRSTILQQQNHGALLAYSLFIDTQDELWMYATNTLLGVYHFMPAGNTWQHFSKESTTAKLNNNIIYGIAQDNTGLIWVGTDHGGVNIIDKNTNAVQYVTNQTDDDKSISQNSIYALYKDNTGIMWVGTFKSGISYYHENMIRFPVFHNQPSNPASLPFNDINRFVEDAKGNLWIGTNGGGLLYFNRKQNTFTQYRHDPARANSLCNDVVVSLLLDRAQKLWIGTYYGGMDCFDGKTFTHYRHNNSDNNSLADDNVWEIYEDAHNSLWIGTLAGGLDRFERSQNRFYHYKMTDSNSITANYVSVLKEDDHGKLWIGTSIGIDVWDPLTRRFSYYTDVINKLSNNNVNAILQAKNGSMWVGTREGLNVLDAGKQTFQSFRTEDGLPDNTIWNILEDNEDNIWVSTPSGISRIIPVKDKTGYHITCTNYDELDGLQSREFNDNAAIKTRSGELAFGGPNGFNLFNPANIKGNNEAAPVVFTDLQVFNKTVLPGEKTNGHRILEESIAEAKKMVLKYNENIFSIEFASLDFSRPEKSKYAYKLEGFNKDWLITDGLNRKITYTNLDAGSYTLHVKTANDDGTWSKEESTLQITVLPPFWKMPLAYLLYAVVFTCALLLARRIVLQRARMKFAIEEERKETQRMHELDLMKTKFFTNVSHEFRTPLSLIITPLDKLIRNTTESEQKNQYQLIQRNARRLLNMVNQLLDFRKLEVQEIKLNLSNGDIIQFMKDVSWSFTDMAEKKGILFSFHSAIDQLYTSFDTDKIERILFNLLSNAFKFTPQHGSIAVTIVEQPAIAPQHLLEIRVQDSGIGMLPEKQERIFERFFQNDIPGSLVNQGSGIGLSITKEFVKLHGGTITVESAPDKGSCFIVVLPFVETAIQSPPPAEEAITEVPTEEIPVTGSVTKPSSKKATLLLVEDNEDFRFYLKDNLKEFYTIIEAGNGKEGWQKALQLHPDLVVSDITMPEMNGIDLCKKIKTDARTKHIPVILLTARMAEMQQVEGYQTGANDYITKPFNFEILQSRIRNLVLQQESLRKTYQKQVEVKTSEVEIGSADEKFIRQALEIVERNMDNADFSVEELSREMFMSRVGLYKKLFSITGKTPIEFIRSIRLKRAAQLLEKSQMTVAEIAYEVGFNNPKYFAKHFKAEFGMLPSVYHTQFKGGE